MQRYMKSEMPFWGVAGPEQKRVFREVFDAIPLRDAGEWRDTVLELWRSASRREERYAAISLTGHRAYRDAQTRETLPLYEELIVTGAWWDYVDGIASHRLGGLLRRFPRWMSHRMRQWSRSRGEGAMWKRRAAILCQLRLKRGIDLALLYDCIEPNLEGTPHGGEFFIRKAIGWALRTHAWADAEAVVRYVDTRGDQLSGLSRREALKNVPDALRSA